MKKSDREKVFNKFGGRCAYCGCDLVKGWHVDHFKPIRRSVEVGNEGECMHPELDCMDNYMPACASCNINKHSASLERFRDLISGFINSLNRDSTQYKIAKRYGLVKEEIKPVVFYFETLTPTLPIMGSKNK